MPRPLSAAAERTVLDLWAARLRVPRTTFDAPGTTFVERPADFPAVVVVELGGAVVVTGPGPALADLRPLPDGALLDGSALLRALAARSPHLVGRARLAYADASSFVEPHLAPGLAVRPALGPDLEDVLSRLTPEEREESGLDDATDAQVLTDATGRPAAACGYEVWDDVMAHVGVAVAADRRGQGLATTVAAAVTRQATTAGLVAQWRARPENVASVRVADRLGYVRLGTQVAVNLGG
ncbi:hypothetical protein Cch01nite_27990 [Cellulomonas chitinilytica]|uniref:N-acetyltransferase domain-containing protein n=1 Tax=Cellulomonas chitinilytica TaxID=398759 RepID=A0A919P3K8_9CELL|nr:GNAT family protein [Cellulomonas chitinilytica]GIG22075.1 hypothetical protein Cch01nite_27990 [Cellulomonas chitinilytica]